MHSRTKKVHATARALTVSGILLAVAPAAWPQDGASASASSLEYKAVYLKHTSSRTDAEDCLNTLRNMALPGLHLYYDPPSNSISLRGTPDEIAQAEQVIAALDIPHTSYRITYTFTETDNGRRVGVQHDSVMDLPGRESTMKEGSRVPIFVSSSPINGAPAGSNITYLDVGLLIDARLDGSPEGLSLQSKVTESGIADDKQSPSMADPVIRQTSLEGSTTVEPGKPLKLGSLDVPGSTRHLDVEVLVEPIR